MATPAENKIQEFSVDLLRVYYDRLFPYDSLFDWLSYRDPTSREPGLEEQEFFSRREFSFTIEDDIYIRYQSFRNRRELNEAISKRQPHKIDIGAVFTAPPKDHNTIDPTAFKTVERELVFDIDMTDYDDIRTCCTGANICLRCWPYMTMAIKVINTALKTDFGFKHILWIYSGRRGVHCWVCDPLARSLSNEARTAVVEYLSVHGLNADGEKKESSRVSTLSHSSLNRAYDILESDFERYIADGTRGQGLLERKDRYVAVLNSIPNQTIRKSLYDNWETVNKTGAQRWRDIVEQTSLQKSASAVAASKRTKIDYNELIEWRKRLVFTHCYPRLDANVSKAQNHLLKSPFCVHPKTGRVCVAIDPDQADEFNPFAVPTVRSLCSEVDAFQDDGDASIKDIDKTSLREYMSTFRKCFMNALASSIRQAKRDNRDKNDAVNSLF